MTAAGYTSSDVSGIAQIMAHDAFDLPPGHDPNAIDRYEVDAMAAMAADNRNAQDDTSPSGDDEDKPPMELVNDVSTPKSKAKKKRGKRGPPKDKLDVNTVQWVREVEKYWLWIKMTVYRDAEVKQEIVQEILISFFRDFVDRRIPGVDFDKSDFDKDFDDIQRSLWKSWYGVSHFPV